MGCLPSRPVDGVVAALQAQVRALQAQLAAQGGGGGYAAPVVLQGGGSGGGSTEVLFFPDPSLPCRHMNNCRRKNCTFAHQPTSLYRFLMFLGSARSTLDVCVFTITCNEIAEALVAAHRRGVRVRVITDNDQSLTTGSDIEQLRASGVPVRMDSDAAHMHHKYAVVDGRLVANGSFNWTRQAVLHNQENVVISDSPHLARTFAQQFERLWQKYAASQRR